jgi:hypothetical protein
MFASFRITAAGPGHPRAIIIETVGIGARRGTGLGGSAGVHQSAKWQILLQKRPQPVAMRHSLPGSKRYADTGEERQNLQLEKFAINDTKDRAHGHGVTSCSRCST